MTCKITRKTEVSSYIETIIEYKDTHYAEWHSDLSIDEKSWKNLKAAKETHNQITGLSGLYAAQEPVTGDLTARVFTNYNTNKELNAGLLANTVIPVLDEAVYPAYGNLSTVAEGEQKLVSYLETKTVEEIEGK
jgi:hypothetical protein